MAETESRLVSRRHTILLLALLGAVVGVILVNAWVSEDAFITFRVIDNWVNGYGLRWNVIERVQAYTHPLWMLLLAGVYLFTKEIYISSIVVSVLCTAAALAVGVFSISRTHVAAVFLLSAAALSAPFVDYATSGLETPLAYCLVAVFVWLIFRSQQNVLFITLVAALLLLTRHDFFVLVVPAMAWLAWRRHSRRDVAQFIVGLSPFLLWEAFSLIYYGSFIPNTAYAKLHVDIPRSEMLTQGLRYVADTAVNAPSVIAVIVIAFWIAARNESKHIQVLMLGVGLYLAYIVWVGGDFMSGRFFAVPFFASLLVVSRSWPQKNTVQVVLFIVLLISGMASARPIWKLVEGGDQSFRFNGIADEKSVYFTHLGLVNAYNLGPEAYPWAMKGAALRGKSTVTVQGNVGLFGYFAGPTVHIVDPFALTDPLLARISDMDDERSEHATATTWRIGHFKRQVPEEYIDSIQSGDNKIRSTEVARIYDEVKVVTQGPIWSKRRWHVIWGQLEAFKF